ncbi:hypothetical protein K7H91_24895, partial [Martelella mediterranea]|uniref:hypothetical protein n=1 Tax=Martelella mediterranea TaxID=293089 RepID=UPI001E53172A
SAWIEQHYSLTGRAGRRTFSDLSCFVFSLLLSGSSHRGASQSCARLLFSDIYEIKEEDRAARFYEAR